MAESCVIEFATQPRNGQRGNDPNWYKRSWKEILGFLREFER
jgi:hypothetical protein